MTQPQAKGVKRPMMKKLFSLSDISRASVNTEEDQQHSHFTILNPSTKKKSTTPVEPLNQLKSSVASSSEDGTPQLRVDWALFYERFQFFLDYQQKSKTNNCVRYAQVRNEVYHNWMTKTLKGFDESLRKNSRKAAHNLNTNSTKESSFQDDNSANNRRSIHQINEDANKAVLKALDALQKKQSGNPSPLSPFLAHTSENTSLENQKQLMLVELWAADILRNFSGSQSLLTSTAKRHIHKDVSVASTDLSQVGSKPEICFLFTQLPFGLTRKPTVDEINMCWGWQLAYDEPSLHINSINLCESVGVILDSQRRHSLGDNSDFKRKMNNVYLENYSCYTTLSYSSLPLADNSQKAVVIYDSYVNVERTELRKTIREFYRVLQPDGIVQFSLMDMPSMVPDGDSDYDKERRFLYDCMYYNAKDEGIDVGCTDSLARLLPQVGFKEVKYSVVAFPGINSLPLYEDPLKKRRSSLGRNVEYAGSFSGMGAEKLRSLSDQDSKKVESTGYKDDDMNALSESLHNYCEFMLMFKLLNLDGSKLEARLENGEISLPEYVKLVDQAKRYIAYKCKERRPEGFEKVLQETKNVPMDDDRDSINTVIDSILPGKLRARRRRSRMHQRLVMDDGMQCGVIVTAKK